MAGRRSGYTPYEDEILCEAFLLITQDPVIGNNQSGDHFWARVHEQYDQKRSNDLESRTTRSLQSRMSTISVEVKRLNACLRQIEYTNPSGASNEDIMKRAKQLFSSDTKFKNGFKFDHVWDMLKDMEKFKDNVSVERHTRRRLENNVYYSSQSSDHNDDSPNSPTTGISSFYVNLCDDDPPSASSQRPIGVKKSKLKSKINEENHAMIKKMTETNKKLMEDNAKFMERAQNIESMMKQQLDMKAKKEENRILAQDLNAILDPTIREYFRMQQQNILQKRMQEQQQQQHGPSTGGNNFDEYFNNIGGSGTGLPDY